MFGSTRVDDEKALNEERAARSGTSKKKWSAMSIYRSFKPGRASPTKVIPENNSAKVIFEDHEPWKKQIFDPGSDAMVKWNHVFLITCLIALFIDPFYFYLPSIENSDQISCVQKMDWGLKVTVTICRSIADIFHSLHIFVKFRTAYTAPNSRVLGRGELVMDAKLIAKRYLKTDFFIDLAAALPLPQIVVWLVIPGVRHWNPQENNNTLALIVLIQYIPRLYVIFPLSNQIRKTTGVVSKTAWAGTAYNLLLYMIASHVIGAAYYLLTIDRQATCWKLECRIENGTSGPPCLIKYLNCDFINVIDQNWANSTNVFTNCDANNDSISFNFGIYQNALTTSAVSANFFRKYFYSLWWGLQNLSTFGQGLTSSTYVAETSFCSLIAILGLILFAHLIGNMETYLQSVTIRVEEWRLRRRDTEQWMRHRQLPEELRVRVRRFVQYKWFATQGVDEDSLLQALPADLFRDIQRHLCLDLVRRVPLFSEMDDQLLDAICRRLISSLSTEGTYIVREGEPVTEMFFVIRGKLDSSTTNGGQTGFFNTITLRPGDFCGEELLSWALHPRSTKNLPYSTRTVRAVVEVEAFTLRAEDLNFVAKQFRRLHSKKLQHTFRYYSHHWRTWAACFIQAAWRRQKRRSSTSFSMSESFSFFAVSPESEKYSSPGLANSTHIEPNVGAVTLASKFSSSIRRGSRRSSGLDISRLPKPDEPDFSSHAYE